jgi:hypothetical protein
MVDRNAARGHEQRRNRSPFDGRIGVPRTGSRRSLNIAREDQTFGSCSTKESVSRILQWFRPHHG